MKAFDLPIRFHDVSTNRDIIVGSIVFSSCFTSAKNNVQIADLILVATAKYLMEFFDIPKDRLDIVTMDSALCEGIAEVAELPTAYDPTLRAHRAEVVVT